MAASRGVANEGQRPLSDINSCVVYKYNKNDIQNSRNKQNKVRKASLEVQCVGGNHGDRVGGVLHSQSQQECVGKNHGYCVGGLSYLVIHQSLLVPVLNVPEKLHVSSILFLLYKCFSTFIRCQGPKSTYTQQIASTGVSLSSAKEIRLRYDLH